MKWIICMFVLLFLYLADCTKYLWLESADGVCKCVVSGFWVSCFPCVNAAALVHCLGKINYFAQCLGCLVLPSRGR